MVKQAFEHAGNACFRLLYLWEWAKVVSVYVHVPV